MTTRAASSSKTNNPALAALTAHPLPGVRVRGRIALEGRSFDDPLVRADRALVPGTSPVRDILDAQYPAGYWMHRGLGISPRYRATVWQVLFLAQLGVGSVPEVECALTTVCSENRDAEGALRVRKGPGGRSPALTAAILWAVGMLGLADAGTWQQTWDWLALQLAAGDPLPPAALVWLARASAIWRREEQLGGAGALAQRLQAAGPQGLLPALSFPLTHRPDVLGWMQALVELGYAALIPSAALASLQGRRRHDGFWSLEHVPGRLWFDAGCVGEANPWITVRALAVLHELD